MRAIGQSKGVMWCKLNLVHAESSQFRFEERGGERRTGWPTSVLVRSGVKEWSPPIEVMRRSVMKGVKLLLMGNLIERRLLQFFQTCSSPSLDDLGTLKINHSDT